MTILDQFITNCNRLVSTLVIKLDGIAFNMNRELIKKGYKIPSTDKENWKYYLNISGQKDSKIDEDGYQLSSNSNEDVYINTIEGTYSNTQDSILLRELLSDTDYIKYSDTYFEIIKKYSTTIRKYGTYTEFKEGEKLYTPEFENKYTEQELKAIEFGYRFSNTELSVLKDAFNTYKTESEYLNNLDITTIRKLLSSKYSKLTPDLLKKYKYTKQYLLTDSEYLSELIDIYPNEYLYILGCVYDIDINTAIEAENGTILGYNTTLVEENEYNLIPSLEAYAKRYLKRYYNHKYVIVDDLYVPSVLGILYSLLLQKVINIRIENMYTNRAHSFHIEAALRSKYDLWSRVSTITPNSKFWLYKNLDRISKNIGKNSTLEEIANNLLSPNDIGLAKLKLITDRPQLNNTTLTKNSNTVKNEDGTDRLFYQEPRYRQYTIPEKQLYTVKLNKEYPTESVIDVIDVVKDETDVFSLNNSKSTKGSLNVNEITEKIQSSYNANNNELTKALDIKMARTFSFHGSNTFQQVMNYLAYILDKHNNYTSGEYTPPVIEFIDPNTKYYYELTPYTAFLVVIKLMLLYIGKDPKNITLTTYNYDEILAPLEEIAINNSDTFWNTYNNYLYQNTYDLPWLNKLHEYYPDTGQTVTSNLAFISFFEEVVHYLDLKFTIESNIQNFLVTTNVKQLHHLLYRSGTLTLTDEPLTVDQLLQINGTTFNIDTDGYDYMKTIYIIIKDLTGIDITGEFTKEESISNFRNILNKLTSYATQIVNVDTEDAITGSEEKYINVYYNRMTISETDLPLITLNMEKKVDNLGMNMYHTLEHYPPELSGTIDTYKTKYDAIILNDTTISTSWVDENIPFKLTGMEIPKLNTFDPSTPPNFSIHVTNVAE